MLPELTVAFPHHRLQQTSGQPALRTLGQSTLSCGWALHGWQLAAPCLCATSSPGPHRVKDLLPTHTSSRAWAHFSTPSAPCVLFYLSSLKGPMCDGGRDGVGEKGVVEELRYIIQIWRIFYFGSVIWRKWGAGGNCITDTSKWL